MTPLFVVVIFQINSEVKYKNDVHLWVFMHVEGRNENFVCIEVVIESVLVIKTVMINWELEEGV